MQSLYSLIKYKLIFTVMLFCLGISFNTQGQTVVVNVCAGENVSLPANITGMVTYQWQVSTDGGITFTSIPGATAQTLTLAAVTLSMNGNQFRCEVYDNTPTIQYSDTYALNIGALTVTFIATNTSCAGSNDGSITVTPTSGSGPFTYSINPGGGPQMTNTFPGLAPGAYTITIADANGCTCTINASIFAAPAITATAVSNATTCSGLNDGSITVTVTSGIAPFIYAIDAGAFLVSNVFQNIPAGVHMIQVKDGNGCMITINVTVDPGPPVANPAIVINGNTTVVVGTSTTITSGIADGGTNPVYQWQDSTDLHSWADISGATSSSISYIPAVTGNSIRCILTSNANCATVNTVTSNTLAFTVTILRIAMNPYPNPAHNILRLNNLQVNGHYESLDITTLDGRQHLINRNIIGLNSVEIDVSGLLNGLYIVVLRNSDEQVSPIRFIKN